MGTQRHTLHHSAIPFYPVCASGAETDFSSPLAARTCIMNATDFHLLARWVRSSGNACAANWVTPLTLPECNAYCAGSLSLLPIMILNAATASVCVHALLTHAT